MTDLEHKLTVRLPKQLHKAAKMKAVESDVTLSEAIRKLLGGWVSGKIELPTEKEIIDDILIELRPLVSSELSEEKPPG